MVRVIAVADAKRSKCGQFLSYLVLRVVDVINDDLTQQAYDACMTTLIEYGKFNSRTASLPLVENSFLAAEMNEASLHSGPDGPWNPRLVEQLTAHATVYIEGARQHLIALTSHLAQNHTGIFMGTSVRSIAEAAGRTIWLLGNDLTVGRDVRRRIARLLLDDEDDARTYRKILDEVKVDDAPSRQIVAEEREKAKARADASWNAISTPGVFREDEILVEVVETTRASQRIDTREAVLLCGYERLPGPAKFVEVARKLTDRPRTPLYSYWCTLTHPNRTAILQSMNIGQDDQGNTLQRPRPAKDWLKLIDQALAHYVDAWRCYATWCGFGVEESGRAADAGNAFVAAMSAS
jgi:hypothetical protein